MTNPLLIAVICLSAANSVSAQAPQYSRSETNTLVYRQETRTAIEVTTPQGPIPVTGSHDATIAVRFMPSDTASATYTDLALHLETPQGSMTPDTAPLIGDAFVLYFPPDGRIQTVRMPEFPESLRGVSDLQWQFWDFFLPLPDEPLRDGLVWSDSASARRGEDGMVKRFGRYEVIGDTVIAGMRTKVIATETETSMSFSGPGQMPGTIAVSDLTGREQGWSYFAPAEGVLVGRKRSGSLSGDVKITGGPQPMTLLQDMEYESTIELLTE